MKQEAMTLFCDNLSKVQTNITPHKDKKSDFTGLEEEKSFTGMLGKNVLLSKERWKSL